MIIAGILIGVQQYDGLRITLFFRMSLYFTFIEINELLVQKIMPRIEQGFI
jgi:hypothetical protein